MNDPLDRVAAGVRAAESSYYRQFPDGDFVENLKTLLPAWQAAFPDHFQFRLLGESSEMPEVPDQLLMREDALRDNRALRGQYVTTDRTYHFVTVPLHAADSTPVGAVAIIDSQSSLPSLFLEWMRLIRTAQDEPEMIRTVLQHFSRAYPDVGVICRIGEEQDVFAYRPEFLRKEDLAMAWNALKTSLDPFEKGDSNMHVRAVSMEAHPDRLGMIVMSMDLRQQESVARAQDGLAGLLSVGLRKYFGKQRQDLNFADLSLVARTYAQAIIQLDQKQLDSAFLDAAQLLGSMLKTGTANPVLPTCDLHELMSELANFYQSEASREVRRSGREKGVSVCGHQDDLLTAIQLFATTFGDSKVSIESAVYSDTVQIRMDGGRVVGGSVLADLLLAACRAEAVVREKSVCIDLGRDRSQDTMVLQLKDAAGSRVLVVDDDDTLRDLLRDILESRQMEVVDCATADEAFAILQSTKVDLVMSDYGLSGQNGLELARRVRADRPGVPFVLITGWGKDLQLSTEERQCIDQIISKPFSLQEVIEVLDACLAEVSGHA